MKKNSKKLLVERDTLRQLATKKLEGVKGGENLTSTNDYKYCQDTTGAGN